MKYSLRSLMTFSIRDLALVTVIVAICVAWWLDHRHQASRAIKAEQSAEESNKMAADAERAKQNYKRVAEMMSDTLLREHDKGMPTLSAPAPNPPKD